MEHTIVHSDLTDSEIKPQQLLREYTRLLEQDIRTIFTPARLKPAGDPVTGEQGSRRTFSKMGMVYHESPTYRNLYIAPRPDQALLDEFYRESQARAFWLKELWPATHDVRARKIIHPQLEWAATFMHQYLRAGQLDVAELLPNQPGYAREIRATNMGWNYRWINPLMNTGLLKGQPEEALGHSDAAPESCDAVTLFETLDRCVNPAAVLETAGRILRPGGLCFLTGLLASGFEVLELGENAPGIVPPERMNILTYEGLTALIAQFPQLTILEFSTPGVLDVSNVLEGMNASGAPSSAFMTYLAQQRRDPELFTSFQDFLQMNKLSAFGRLVLRKRKTAA